MRLEEKIARLCVDHHLTLALAESCTGGLLGHRLTNIPGSSEFFRFGAVTYSNEAKQSILRVSSKTLKDHGAVSEQAAEAMAKGVRKLAGTHFGISVTGIAGPTGGSRAKPVGLTFISISTPEETLTVKCQFKGSRLQIKKEASTTALELLLEFFPEA